MVEAAVYDDDKPQVAHSGEERKDRRIAEPEPLVVWMQLDAGNASVCNRLQFECELRIGRVG